MQKEIPTTELSPLADYSDYLDQEIPTPWLEAVWACVLDKKYGVEVQRDSDKLENSYYKGILCVFDLTDNQKLVHSEPTTFSYGALFGPDVEDVARWQDRIIEVVEKIQESSLT